MLISKIILILLFHKAHCKTRALTLITSRIIQDSMEVKQNDFPEYVRLKIELINPGTENSYFNLEGTILKELPPEIEINLNVDKLNQKGQYKPTPFTIKKNYCAYMTMDKAIYPMLVKKGNFPTKCPVKPGNYFINHFSVTPKDLPISVPVGSYRITFAYNLKGKLIKTIWKGRSIPI